MLYLIGQILICLCFAAVIGFAVGWLLRGPGSRDELDTRLEEWRLREGALRRDVERQREAAQDLERRLDDAQTAYRKAAIGEETAGILVEPPTITTWSTSAMSMPASLTACLKGETVR